MNDKAKLDAEKSLEEMVAEQDRVLQAKVETKTEARTSSQWSPNWTIRFPKLDHSFCLGSGQKKASRTFAPGMAPAPHWCPPGLMPNQRRRIQWMRAHKMREEATKKREMSTSTPSGL
jgi:hypothetical protein